MKSPEEVAREISSALYVAPTGSALAVIASAVRQSRQEGREQAAKVVEEMFPHSDSTIEKWAHLLVAAIRNLED